MSVVANEQKKKDSVFDFLYADRQRIGLYLSQFSDFGNLTNLVHSSRTGDETTLSAGVPSLAKGESKQNQQTGVERHFDTQWSQVLNFLDEVQARQMLRRDIETTPIGSLFLVSGNLYLANMRSFEKTWGAISSEPATTPQGNRHARRGKPGQRQQDAPPRLDGLKILGSLEQPVFTVFQSGKNRLWSTLDPNYLSGGSADLNLKHGLRVAGVWHMLGTLDCQPGSGDDVPDGRLCGGGDNIFSDSIVSMWREFRLVFGRPADCFGITPIVIMREIG
jgi:hypothetical protein